MSCVVVPSYHEDRREKCSDRLTHNPAACVACRNCAATTNHEQLSDVGGNKEREMETTHTETCVPYRLFEMMRNELRPFPPGLSVVVSSARRMKLLPFGVASPRLSASARVT